MTELSPITLFKALADETRARIALLVMQEGELCVCELTCALGEIQPKVSRHLALLRQVGLLADRRKGQWIYYRLHPELPDWVPAMLQPVLTANAEWLRGDTERLTTMGDRPARQAMCC